MRFKRCVFFTLLFVSCLAKSVSAQITNFSYSCNFEDTTENAAWVLNKGNQGTTAVNRWYIGEATNNGGNKSMYISSTGGVSATYTNSAVSIVAYREFTGVTAGTYDVAFDWKAFGNSAGTDALYVCWVPLDENTNSAASSTPPSWVNEYMVNLSDAQNCLYGSASWQTESFRLTTDGTDHKLVFVWVNGNATPNPPGACVDNITIVDADACAKPSSLTVATSGSTIFFSWAGVADSYEVKCYSNLTKKWLTQTVTDTVCTFLNVEEGACDFYVRGICDGKASVFVSTSDFIYYPEIHCIDYLTLTNKNCYVAAVPLSSTSGSNIQFTQEKVDNGYAAISSRHTIHYVQGETDLRTNGGLMTIPDGALASVRLGNWNNGREAERIRFSYTVDASSNPVLLLKYAVILQDPGHDETAQPRFTMSIKRGNVVVNCASADFAAGSGGSETWNRIEKADTWDNASDILWKDWTTIGVNLADYDGQTLTVELTTYDCSQGAHYGYAYFTLDCSDGQLDGINCGDTPTNEFIAPAGFDYSWYKTADPTTILGTNQRYQVDTRDTCKYACDIIFPENDQCYFTLYACAIPRYPVAQVGYVLETANCQHTAAFTNTSHVMTVNQITNDSVHITTEPCETVRWDFGDGTYSLEYSPIHTYPQLGGQYVVTMTVGISNDMCTEVWTDTLEFQTIGTTMDTIDVQACVGTAYRYNGKSYWNTGIYTDTLTSSIGCDSIIVLNLEFKDRINVSIDTLICSGDTVLFDGIGRTQSGVYVATYQSSYGCDSVVTFNLHVHPTLHLAELDTAFTICADDQSLFVPFAFSNGSASRYNLFFQGNNLPSVENGNLLSTGVEVKLPKTILPNEYTGYIEFMDTLCGNAILPIYLTINYADTILTQRWNDVLAVRNSQYNGGFFFSAYQWYKNGVELLGETDSYLYVPEGLEHNAYYTVLLTRADDNVSLFVCPVIPNIVDEALIPTVASVSSEMPITTTSSAQVSFYSASGTLVSVQQVSPYSNILKTPSNVGLYILKICYENGTYKTQRIMIK